MFLLVPAHPGFPGQIPQSRKTVVCVFRLQLWPNDLFDICQNMFKIAVQKTESIVSLEKFCTSHLSHSRW